MADHNSVISLHVKQGEDFSAKVEWTDEDGNGFDLATEAALQTSKLEVRDKNSDLVFVMRGDQDYQWTDKNGEEQTNNTYQGYIFTYPKGEFHLFIPWHVADDIPKGTYYFDMFAEVDLKEENQFKPSGTTQRRCVMSGRFIVRPKITAFD